MGGLGIRSAVHLAPSAFLASAGGSLELVHKTAQAMQCPVRGAGEARVITGELAMVTHHPCHQHHFRQKVWDLPRVQERVDHLMSTTKDARSRARLLAASTKESEAWLKALPVTSLGLRLDDETVCLHSPPCNHSDYLLKR